MIAYLMRSAWECCFVVRRGMRVNVGKRSPVLMPGVDDRFYC